MVASPKAAPIVGPRCTVPNSDPEHEARARLAIERAVRDIPFYSTSPKVRPLPRPDAPLASELAKIPLLFKHDLRATLPKQWVPTGRDVKAELASGKIEFVETSGSTGDRTRILWDKGWWLNQEERAFCTNGLVARALSSASTVYREAILTTPVCGLGSCHAGDLSLAERTDEHRLFLNTRADPTFWKPTDMDRMLDEMAQHDTVGLETDPMYLAVLSRYAGASGRTLPVRGFVALTYGFTSAAHTRGIRRAYSGPAYQLYGASEVGVLFMEGEDGKLHHCPLTTHVELVPIKVSTPGAENVALVVVTTLDRVVQPLVRFVVGDLVQVEASSPRRFTTVPALQSVEGRLHDAVLRPDGALVTAGAIDRALSAMEDIAFYQVNQRTTDRVEIDVVTDSRSDGALAEIEARLAPLLLGLAVSTRRAAAVAAEPSGKFRIVRRHFPLKLGSLFDGCDGISL